MRVRGYRARTDLARKERRRGKQGSRKDEARAGGASQQSGPFRSSLGPFSAGKGVLFLLDFSVGLPEALPWGQQPEEGGVSLGPQFTVAGTGEVTREEGWRSVMVRARASKDFSGWGVCS